MKDCAKLLFTLLVSWQFINESMAAIGTPKRLNIDVEDSDNKYTEKPLDTGFSMSCGSRTVPFDPHRNPKIVGGAVAPYGAFPWQVQIQMFRYDEMRFEHHCGGSVIGERLIITAAHCVQISQQHHLRLVVGNHDLFKRDLFEHSFRVDSILVHPDFRRNGPYSNDIALLKVRAKNAAGIIFNTHVRPICLPASADAEDFFFPGMWCTVTGWGMQRNKDAKSVATILRAAAVPLLDQQTCRQADVHGGGDGRTAQQPILDTMLCAGFLQGGIDSCGGDSGGPLTCQHGDRFYLAGLVSWGDGCAKKNRPGVYTRVDSFIDWINSSIEQLAIKVQN